MLSFIKIINILENVFVFCYSSDNIPMECCYINAVLQWSKQNVIIHTALCVVHHI